MKLAYTRRMVNAALNGELDDVEMITDPFFGLALPAEIEGVPSDVLNPRSTWANTAAYDAKARELAGMFAENFEKYSESVSEAVLAAGTTATEVV